jgi:aminoglycoside phosphotransferase family enzyme
MVVLTRSDPATIQAQRGLRLALGQERRTHALIEVRVLAKLDNDTAPTLEDKVAFLSGPAAYAGRQGPVARRETHMSWLFFLDGAVYKLKKPVRFPYLDFSTLERRGAACRSELALNQQLAPGIYEGVVPLVLDRGTLRLGGRGEVVDWLVRMQRFDQNRTLEARLRDQELAPAELEALGDLLAKFYRRAQRVHVAPEAYLKRWRAELAYDRQVLLNPRLGLPAGLVRHVLAAQAAFMRRAGLLLADRARDGRILDAHGDLRPEHVWMGPPIKIIDRLEFSVALRAVDPLDELAFLDVETERLGAPEVGAALSRRVAKALAESEPPELYLFYRCARATLRARLAIAHLLEPNPRTPEKWPKQARAYLAIAARDARRLEVRLRRPRGP